MIDQNMNRREIHQRQLAINVELGELSEQEIALRRMTLNLEEKAAKLNHELAELALLESQFGPPLSQRVKHAG